MPLVVSDKILLAYKMGARWLPFLIISLFFNISAEASETANQNEFRKGLSFLFNSNYSDAEAVFENLFVKTKAPRVKLEWARSAYLNKKYELSKKLFEEVMESDIPESVRFNIMIYLNQLNELTDHIDYRINFVRDTNPQGSSKPQIIIIYGIPFEYVPIQQQETLNGINLGVYYSKRIMDSKDQRLILDFDLTDYYEGDVSKYNGRVAFESSLVKRLNLKYKIGYDALWKNNENLLNQTYVSLLYSKNKINGFYDSISSEFKYSQNKYVEFSDASANVSSISLGVAKGISESVRLSGGLYLDNAEAKSPSFDYQTLSVSGEIKMHVPLIKSHIKISLANTLRGYGDLDELFLKKRKDNTRNIGMTLMPYNIKVYGLYPSLNITHEKIRSNIKINSYSGAQFNIGLKKRF